MNLLVGKDGILTKAVEVVPGGGYITGHFHEKAGNLQHAEKARDGAWKGHGWDKDGLYTQALETAPFGGYVTAGFHSLAGNDEHATRAVEKATNQLKNPVGKDGVITQVVEFIPGGGCMTAPFHAAAGNHTEAFIAGASGMYGLGSNQVMKVGVTTAVKNGVSKISMQSVGKTAAGRVAGVYAKDAEEIKNDAKNLYNYVTGQKEISQVSTFEQAPMKSSSKVCGNNHPLVMVNFLFKCARCPMNYLGDNAYCSVCRISYCPNCL